VLTLALYGLLAIVLAVALFLLGAYLLPSGEQIAPPVRDEPPWELPAGTRLRAEDVSSVRLPVALRGYRFAETDLLLDRLATELEARDEEIARLKGHSSGRHDELDEHAERWQPADRPTPDRSSDRAPGSAAGSDAGSGADPVAERDER
jgi:DivIVA domain-containing protein